MAHTAAAGCMCVGEQCFSAQVVRADLSVGLLGSCAVRHSGMSSVSCVGLGNMGSALAYALLGAGHDVTVWNRTAAKAGGLVERGALLAETVADAIAASPVTVVCLRGYDVTLSLLESPDAVAAVQGRIVVQLGGAAPSQVNDVAAVLADRGARYLDGGVFGFPRSVGTQDCQILVSGDRVAFDEASEILGALAGDVRYLGERYDVVAAVEGSAAGFLYAAACASVVAAAMGDAAGAPVDAVAGAVSRYALELPPLVAEFAAMIDAGEYSGPNLRLASGIENLGAIIAFGQASGVDVSLLEAAQRSFLMTAEADHGDSVAAVFEILRRREP